MSVFRPTVNGGTISVLDSASLAAMSADGLPLGSSVWNIDVGAFFKLTDSTASLVPDSVVAVLGITGQRWIVISNVIPAGSVTNAMLANEAAATIKGRASGAGTGAVTDLTADQVRTIMNGSTLQETVTFAGSAGSPSVKMGSDANTGVYGNGASVGMSSDGAIIVHVPVSQVDAYFRAAAGQTNIGAAAGSGTLATNATSGFPAFPTCAGTPIGTPTVESGRAALVVDTSAGKLWAFYGAAWHDLTGA